MIRYGRHVASSASVPFSSLIALSISHGLSCMQVFFGSPNDIYKRRILEDQDVAECIILCQDFNFAFYTHFPYTMKLVAKQTVGKLKGLQEELDRIAPFKGRVVIHPNSSPCCCSLTNRDSLVECHEKKFTLQSRELARILAANLELLKFPPHDYPLLLEPPAGEGKKFGWSFEHMEMIVKECGHLPVGFCLDTCHVFCSGVCKFDSKKNVNEFFAKLQEINVLERVKAIHFNDSQHEFGEMKDRHAPIGEGYIWNNPDHASGLVALFRWCYLYNIDVICEVGTDDDLFFTKLLIDKVSA